MTSLQLANKHHIKTIAFPSISTGAYRFPFEKAFKVAKKTIKNCLIELPSIEVVYMVFYSEGDYNQSLSNHLLSLKILWSLLVDSGIPLNTSRTKKFVSNTIIVQTEFDDSAKSRITKAYIHKI